MGSVRSAWLFFAETKYSPLCIFCNRREGLDRKLGGRAFSSQNFSLEKIVEPLSRESTKFGASTHRESTKISFTADHNRPPNGSTHRHHHGARRAGRARPTRPQTAQRRLHRLHERCAPPDAKRRSSTMAGRLIIIHRTRTVGNADRAGTVGEHHQADATIAAART